MDATEPRPHQFVVRGKVGLGVAVEADTTGAEPLEVQSGDHALAAKPVQRPEQHAIEPALMGSSKSRANCLRSLTPFRPLSRSMYSWTSSPPSQGGPSSGRALRRTQRFFNRLMLWSD